MAGRVGQIANDRTWGVDNPHISNDLNSFGQTAFTPTLALKASVGGGQGTYSHFKVNVANNYAISGQIAPAFLYDFYFRVHLTPFSLKLGDITGVESHDVELWNSHLTPQSLGSISKTGDDDITLIQPTPTPTVLQPLEYRIYQVRATLEGAPEILAQFNFNFPTESPNLIATGSRVRLFPYPPNRKLPLVETLEWKTDVLRAFSGKEQRRKLRNIPRRSFEFDIQVSGEDAQYWQNLMWGWQARTFAIPIWTDKTTLVSGALAGAMTLTCHTVDLGFQNGGTLVIYVNNQISELCDLLSFGAGVIRLKRPLNNAWPAGTAVYPCVFARLPEQVTQTRHTDSVLTSRCLFTTSPLSTDPTIASTPSPTLYDGLEVITIQPNWINGLQQEYSHKTTGVDFSVGVTQYLGREKNPVRLLPFSWLLSDRIKIAELRSFLGRQSGRLKTCWLPSWTSDFTVASYIQALEFTITVRENNFARFVGINPNNDRIMIRTRSNGVFYRKILGVGISSDGVNPALTIDAQLGVTLQTDDIIAIHLLHRVRLATDKFDFQWHTNGVATLDTNFMTIDQ